jgi:hypothetical protein
MTGLDPVIHEAFSTLEGDGRNRSGHDDRGSRDFALPAFIVVRL